MNNRLSVDSFDDGHSTNMSANRSGTGSLLRASNLHSSVISTQPKTGDSMDAGDIIVRLRSAVDKVWRVICILQNDTQKVCKDLVTRTMCKHIRANMCVQTHIR